MKKPDNKNTNFSKMLKEALDLSFKKMVEEKRKDNDVLAIGENGKVVKIKARDFKFKN